MSNGIKLLFSSCGRRVELLRSFRDALDAIGGGVILGCDIDPLAAALQVADQSMIVPPCADASFIEAIINICKTEGVDAVVPLIDTELAIYAKSRALFSEINTTIIISDPETIEKCASKTATASLFMACNLPALKTMPLDQWLARGGIDVPAIIKPDIGSAGIGVNVLKDIDEAALLSRDIVDPVVQEMARGQEVTIDCLVDKSGKLVRYVARERLEIRAGESSKGRTFKDKRLEEMLLQLFDNLNAFGPITVQCFRTNDDYVFSEINPRFGGGYPLAHAAGADFPRLLISMIKGEAIEGALDDYKEDVYMTRYDQAFYLSRKDESGAFLPGNMQ